MRVILNPENGAPIQNVQIKGQFLFKETPFEPDSMRSIESDSVAESLLSLYGFLQELDSKEKIEAYLEEKKTRAFKCEKCKQTFSIAIALQGHMKKHESEQKLVDELGIEIVRDSASTLTGDELERQRELAQKAHLDSMGITGGWEDDAPQRHVIM